MVKCETYKSKGVNILGRKEYIFNPTRSDPCLCCLSGRLAASFESDDDETPPKALEPMS
jgi:hypothetical protein